MLFQSLAAFPQNPAEHHTSTTYEKGAVTPLFVSIIQPIGHDPLRREGHRGYKANTVLEKEADMGRNWVLHRDTENCHTSTVPKPIRVIVRRIAWTVVGDGRLCRQFQNRQSYSLYTVKNKSKDIKKIISIILRN